MCGRVLLEDRQVREHPRRREQLSYASEAPKARGDYCLDSGAHQESLNRAGGDSGVAPDHDDIRGAGELLTN